MAVGRETLASITKKGRLGSRTEGQTVLRPSRLCYSVFSVGLKQPQRLYLLLQTKYLPQKCHYEALPK